jgi:transketolase C-terminal domain/subunit
MKYSDGHGVPFSDTQEVTNLLDVTVNVTGTNYIRFGKEQHPNFHTNQLTVSFGKESMSVVYPDAKDTTVEPNQTSQVVQ